MSVCRSQEATVAAVLSQFLLFLCDFHGAFFWFFFSSVSGKRRFCAKVKGQGQWSTISASPFLTWSIRRKKIIGFSRWKVKISEQGHFLIVVISFYFSIVYLPPMLTWIGERNSFDICGWKITALSCLRKVKSDDASIIYAVWGAPRAAGGGASFCRPSVLKAPGQVAESLREVLWVKL